MAANDTVAVFSALDNEAPSSAFATFDARNLHPVLDFDAATIESAVFGGVMPKNYGGGSIAVKIHFAATSATSGDVVWGASLERIGDDVLDIDADSFAAEATVTKTTSATSGNVVIASVTLSGAGLDGVLAGDAYRLKIRRVATDAGDTMAGDAELRAVELREA